MRLILLAANTAASTPPRKPALRPDHLTAAELSPGATYVEGAAHPVVVNCFERNHAARMRCLLHFGGVCSVCGFEFERVNGEEAAGYVPVHHIVPIASIGQEYRLDPLRDVRPVCPNCHAVIHRREPPYSLEEVRRMPGRKSRPQAGLLDVIAVDWLDDDARVHPCNFESAYAGFEITMALCRSVVSGGQVALPLAEPADELAQLKAAIPDRKVLLSMAANAKEYGA